MEIQRSGIVLFAFSKERVEFFEIMFDLDLLDYFSEIKAYFGDACVMEMTQEPMLTGFAIHPAYSDNGNLVRITGMLKEGGTPENLFLICRTHLLPFIIHSVKIQDEYGDNRKEASFFPFIAEA